MKHSEVTDVGVTKKEFLTAHDISNELKLSLSKAYALMDHPECPTMYIGRSKRVERLEFYMYLDTLKN